MSLSLCCSGLYDIDKRVADKIVLPLHSQDVGHVLSSSQGRASCCIPGSQDCSRRSPVNGGCNTTFDKNVTRENVAESEVNLCAH